MGSTPERVRGRSSGERGIISPLGTVVSPVALGWLGAAFGILVLALSVESGERMLVVLPIVAVTASAWVFCWRLRRHSEDRFPYFEIGVVYVAIVWLYTVFPLVGFLVNGLRQTPANDLRLYLFRPSSTEMGLVGWYHVAHLTLFATTYLLWRGRGRRRATALPVPDRATVVAASFAYLAISAYFLFLDWRFDLSARTYLESYLVTKRLPLELAQVANHLGGVGGARFVLELVILAALFGGYPRWRPVIVGWLVVMAALAFIRLGSRTEVVLLMVAVAMMYHHGVRQLRFWHVGVGSVIALSFFLLLGILRHEEVASTMTAEINPIFGYASEFENNFANAYDVGRLKALGLIRDLPVAFYLADLLALVPQQLLPVEKVSPAVWYVSTFYPDYAAAGGGMAFGSIAESILGGGWVDAMGRAAVLGLLLAQVHRFCARSGAKFWSFIFYVWATVSVYQSFRATTFVLVGYVVYRFLPVAIGVATLASVLRAMPPTRVAWARARAEPAG